MKPSPTAFLLLFLAPAAAFGQVEAYWSLTPQADKGRGDHTATLLPDGRVLVVGGYDNSESHYRAELFDPHRSSWTSAGDTAYDRAYHTATLLKNGKVLVAGGDSSSGNPAATELYDPKTNSWTTAGALTAPRRYHTATLLQDGNVLVVGGQDGSGGTTAELYDVAQDSWVWVGGTTDAHDEFATATLLPNGKVLVTGGGSNGTTSAELYDPVSKTFSAASPMNQARFYHSATLLLDGNVLVAGGLASGSDLTAAEVYDPGTDTWHPSTGSLSTGRYYQIAVRQPDGKVLIAGGSNDLGASLSSAELYDPAAGTFSNVGAMNAARNYAKAVQLTDGSILVTGGYGGTYQKAADHYWMVNGAFSALGGTAKRRLGHTATLMPDGRVAVIGGDSTGSKLAELFSPASDTFTSGGSMSIDRFNHTATLLSDGKILVVGGYSDEGRVKTAEIYDSAEDAFTARGDMAVTRVEHTATLLRDGRVLIAGGMDDDGYPRNTCEIFDPVTGQFTATGSLITKRQDHAATLLSNGKVLVAGGIDDGGTRLDSVELWDPATGNWTATGSMTEPRLNGAMVRLADGRPMMIGGETGSGYSAFSEAYDPATGVWTQNGEMGWARQYHTATLLPDGRVLVAGGNDGGSHNVNIELYDPATKNWLDGPDAGTGRSFHTATLLLDGRVLLIGGMDTAAQTSEAAFHTIWDYRTATDRPVVSTLGGSASGVVSVASGALVAVTGTDLIGPPTQNGEGLPRAYLRGFDGGNYGPMADTPQRVDVSTSIYEQSFGATSLSVRIPERLPNGYYTFWVQTAGAKSEARVVRVAGPATGVPAGTGTAGSTVSGDGVSLLFSSHTLHSVSGDEGQAIAAAPNGDIYVAGYIQGPDTNAWIGRYGQDNVLKGSTTFSGPNNNAQLYGIAADASSNLYVTGVVNVGGELELLVAKYSEALAFLSSSSFKGANNIHEGHGVVLDPGTGDVYVAAIVPSDDGTRQRAWVGRWDSDLTVLKSSHSITPLNASVDEGAFGVARDSSGKIYVSAQQDNFSSIYLGKFTADLTPITSVSITDMKPEWLSQVAVGPTGAVYVAGKNASTNKPALAKYTSGLTRTAFETYGTRNGYLTALFADGAGGLYAGGSVLRSNQDMLFMKVDSDLALLSSSTLNGTANDWDYAAGVTVTESSAVFFTGGAQISGNQNDIWTGRLKQTPAGTPPDHGDPGGGEFTAIGSPLTTLKSSHTLDSGGGDEGQSVVVAPNGDIYVAGYVQTPGTYGWIGRYGPGSVLKASATYTGPDNNAQLYGIDVDGDNHLYVVGIVNVDGRNEFVVIKYDQDLKLLSSYNFHNGQNNNHEGHGVLVDPDTGDIYVSAYVPSDDGSRQVAWLGRFDYTLSVLKSSHVVTPVNAGQDEAAFRLARDPGGNIYVVAAQEGYASLYIGKFSPSLVLMDSVNVSGRQAGWLNGIAVLADGSVFVSGTHTGDNKAWIGKFDSNLDLDIEATYGTSSGFYGMRADSSGALYATGWTTSGGDVFTVQVASADLSVLSSSIFPGSGGSFDYGSDVAFAASSAVYVTGNVNTAESGNGDIWLGEYHETSAPPLSFAVTSLGSVNNVNTSIAVDAAGKLHGSYTAYIQGSNPGRYTLNYASFTTVWSTRTIEAQGDMYGNQVAIGSDGRPRIGYAVYDDVEDRFQVKFASFNGVNWSTSTVDSELPSNSLLGNTANLAFGLDGLDQPHFAYAHGDATTIRYASLKNGVWVIETVASLSANPDSMSMAVDAKGYAHVIYRADDVLHYAWKLGASSGWIDAQVDSGADLYAASVALDGAGKPRVTYRKGGDLKLAVYAGGAFTLSTITTASNVKTTALALDGAGNAHVVYDDSDNIMYARYADGAWSVDTVQDIAGALENPSLALDASGNPHILYNASNVPELRYATTDAVDAPAPLGGNPRGKVQAPSAMRATAVHQTSATWAWTDGSSNEQGFILYGSTDATGPFAIIASSTTLGSNTTYDESGLTAGSTYFRFVAAAGPGGSVFSNPTVAVSTPLPALSAVTDVFLDNATATSLRTNFSSFTLSGVTYQVDLATSADFGGTLVTDTAGSSAINLVTSGLASNTTYYSRVTAKKTGYLDSPATAAAAPLATKPAQPSTVAIATATTTSLTVTWSTAGNGSTTRYEVGVATSADFSGTVIVSTTAATNRSSSTVSGLAPNSQYFARVRTLAVSDIRADDTATVDAVEPAETHPLAPADVLLQVAVSTSQLTVAWDSDANGAETRYQVELATSADFAGSIVTSTTAATHPLNLAVSGLAADTTYFARVKTLAYSGLNADDSAYTAAAAPVSTLPGAPTGVSISTTSTTQATVAWTTGTNGSRTRYEVAVSTSAGFTGPVSISTTAASNPASFAVPSLIPNTTYYARVRTLAVSDIRSDDTSAVAAAAPVATLPQAPSTVSIQAALGTSQLAVIWSADTNAADTRYQVAVATSADFGGSVAVSTTAATHPTSAIVTSLTPNTTYFARVKTLAVSDLRANDSSASAAAAPVATKPATPGSVAIAAATSGTQLDVSWNGSGNGGATRYSVELGTAPDFSGAGAYGTSAAGAVALTVSGLVPNTTYFARVAALAVSDIRSDDSSSAAAAGEVATLPQAPSTVQVATTGPTGLDVTVGGGANGPDTRYRIDVATDTGFGAPVAVSTTAAGVVSSSFPGLTPNTTYYARARALAVSDIRGDDSNATVSAAAVTPPLAPTGVALSSISATSLSASWTSANNAQTAYRVELATTSGFTGTLTTGVSAAGASSLAVGGLTPNTTYYGRVAALGSGGEALSGASGAKSTPATAPTGAALDTPTASSLRATWSSANAADTRYRVQLGTSADLGGTLVSSVTAAGAAQAVIPGLASQTTYFARVSAIAHDGADAASAVSAGVETLILQPDTPGSLLGSPLGVSSITWTWGAAARAVTYNFYPSTGGPAIVLSGTSLTQAQLSTNTAYGARVSATNSSGEGAQAALVTVYTLAAPATSLISLDVGIDSATLSWSANTNAGGIPYRVAHFTAGGSTVSAVVTTTSATLSGLVGGSTYFVRVYARNGDGAEASAVETLTLVTLPIQAAVADIPTGGGVIEFSPPTGDVALNVPSGAFNQTVTITVSQPDPGDVPAAGTFRLEGTGVAIEILVSQNLQPGVPVSLSISYRDADISGLDEGSLIISRYDPVNRVWVPLVSSVDPATNKVTALTDHFSLFQIMAVTPSGTVKTVKVFPNPLRPKLGHTAMTFSQLPAGAKLRIFTLVGEKVRDLTADSAGMASWDGRNGSGAQVASGVYFVHAEAAGGGSKTFKVAVQR